MFVSEQSQRPTTDDRDAWKVYWEAQDMSWRTEPEVFDERQRYLAERRAVKPDVEKGVYPFRDEQGSIKLTRADVEWLLATHNDGRGPVRWEEVSHLSRGKWPWGVDLRGADLQGRDLRELPLAGMQGGLTWEEWSSTNQVQVDAAAVRLEDADLRKAHLEFAALRGAHLERAYAREVGFQGADLFRAHLEGASLYRARFAGAGLATDGGVPGSTAHGRMPALPPADLRRAFLDRATNLHAVSLGDRVAGGVRLADVQWGEANLARVNWPQAHILGDERKARIRRTSAGTRKDRARRLEEFADSVRANRQLALVLRAQGMSEVADRFAFRAQLCQRVVLRYEHHYLRYVGSWLLDLLSGYGYKPLRSFFAYAFVILAFASLYLFNAQFAAPHLTWDESIVLSVSSFHGRGFFSSGISLGDTLARLAAGEAIIGLLIEITFIATFTQRFFAR
jgi:uncharacterized protein YjbI with pentapeptide repeats